MKKESEKGGEKGDTIEEGKSDATKEEEEEEREE